MSDQPRTYLHINRGVNNRYCARVRKAGHRRWHVLGGGWTKNRRRAFRALADAMESDGHWKRGQILHIADYYDPIVMVEMTR